MKSAIRNINDALFVSSIAAVLFSYSKLLDTNIKVTGEAILLSLFFFAFRIKSYLDDNASLAAKEKIHGESNKIPDIADKAHVIFSFITWVMYSTSGYYLLFRTDYSYTALGWAFIVISLYSLFMGRLCEGKEQRVYFIFNIIYILLLALLHFSVFRFAYSSYYILGAMIVALIADYIISKSLDKIYK